MSGKLSPTGKTKLSPALVPDIRDIYRRGIHKPKRKLRSISIKSK